MENQKELFELILRITKQNQQVSEEIKSCLDESGLDTGKLNHLLSSNNRKINELEKLFLGDEYGKPSNIPGL